MLGMEWMAHNGMHTYKESARKTFRCWPSFGFEVVLLPYHSHATFAVVGRADRPEAD